MPDTSPGHPRDDLSIPDAATWRRWGLEPSWSRTVEVSAPDRPPVTWHVLDTGSGPRGTVVCVHGNPTWGYVWKGFLTTLAPDWRVIAVDQTGMGFSERTGARTLADRVAELVAFCRQETDGPIVLVAHDWGGPTALGAASELEVRAVVLGNTAVARPEGVAVPPLIAAARRTIDATCRRTPAFVAGTARMTAPEHRDALRAPYRSPQRRQAVADYVADIPLHPGDASWEALGRSAANLESLRAPVLIVWGGRDPVFHDRFLADLVDRAPHADVHRFPNAGHLVALDAPMAEIAARWLDQLDAPRPPSPGPVGPAPESFRDVTAALGERQRDDTLAYAGPDGTVTWSELHASATRIAGHLAAHRPAPRGARRPARTPRGGDALRRLRDLDGRWRARGRRRRPGTSWPPRRAPRRHPDLGHRHAPHPHGRPAARPHAGGAHRGHGALPRCRRPHRHLPRCGTGPADPRAG